MHAAVRNGLEFVGYCFRPFPTDACRAKQQNEKRKYWFHRMDGFSGTKKEAISKIN
jgi:hypothetical protein